MNTYKTTQTAGQPVRWWNRISPLVYPAAALSAASLVWTGWSLTDLIGAGSVGITVAVGADVIWGAVIFAEARGTRVQPFKGWNLVPLFGWLALLAVATLLFWHGIDSDSAAMAVAGPFLPLGGKVVWMLALADMRDPSALTDSDEATLAEMERGMKLEEAKHRLNMRRQLMQGEMLVGQVETDFSVELKRDEARRELSRRRPLEIEPVSQPVSQVSHPVEFPQASPVETVSHGNSPEVEFLVNRLKAGETLSAARAGELIGVSRATGGRRLAEAKAAHSAWMAHQTGHYV